MLNRHISFSLALRYLNPLRTYFSIITLICLVGVSLGVMVLIVVLSVMSGLIKDVQGKLLAFSPHLQVNYYQIEGWRGQIKDWQATAGNLTQIPDVKSAYGVIEDNALIDVNGTRRPCFFRAIDSENPLQMQEMQSLIRDGSFDLSMGEQVVVSSIVADSMRINVGDSMGVLTLRNMEGITRAYAEVEKDLLVNRYPAEIKKLTDFAAQARKTADGEEWSVDNLRQALQATELLLEEGRTSEQEIFSQYQQIILSPNDQESGKSDYTYPGGTADKLLALVRQAASMNKDREDLANFRQIKEFVLPKDLEVLGIYGATQHVISPDLFVPLNIGQDLLGYDDDKVQSIALRVEDPYSPLLDQTVANVMAALPTPDGPGYWTVETWKQRYEDWFTLMQRERLMMNFVLSVISLISAFCIMAVMFTVAMQRKKELAVIKALGATPSQIIRVFLWQGVIIGLAGAILGVLLALLILHYRAPIHSFLIMINFDPFPMDFHGVELPAEINPAEVAVQAVKAFFMVVAASIIPAIFTAYQDPAKALRSL